MSVNPLSALSSNKEAQSDNEVSCKLEDYIKEVDKGEPIQVGDPPLTLLAHLVGSKFVW